MYNGVQQPEMTQLTLEQKLIEAARQENDYMLLMQANDQVGTLTQRQPRRRIRKQKNPNAATNSASDSNGNSDSAKLKKGKKLIDDNVSIEEALKALTMTAEGANSAVKTPVSVLQELLSRRGITPSYDLVQIEGAIHEPTFRYRVTFGPTKDGQFLLNILSSFYSFNYRFSECGFAEAMGAGRSKKEAKHQAARNLIDKLTGVITIDPIILPPVPEAKE